MQNLNSSAPNFGGDEGRHSTLDFEVQDETEKEAIEMIES